MRKSGQSYLISLAGTVAYNSAMQDDHQVLFDEFVSEEQILYDIETAFDQDGIIQITVNPWYYFQNDLMGTYDESSLFDHGAVSKTLNAVFIPNRPYFFPVFQNVDDIQWKVTRKLHKRLKQGQLMLFDARHEDRNTGSAATAGSGHIEYIAKMDIACVKGRH